MYFKRLWLIKFIYFLISNNLGTPDFGVGLLLKEERIKRIVGSFFGENIEVIKKYNAGELEVELIPMV